MTVIVSKARERKVVGSFDMEQPKNTKAIYDDAFLLFEKEHYDQPNVMRMSAQGIAFISTTYAKGYLPAGVLYYSSLRDRIFYNVRLVRDSNLKGLNFELLIE